MAKNSKEVQARADAKRKGRTRNFATVVYPESAPENWQEILSEFCVSAFISPLHDRDILPTGEPKKPHFHVLIMFDVVKTKEQAKAILGAIGGVGCETIESLRGYARYLCHLDSPDKVQYEPSNVTCFAGADYTAVIGLASDKYKAIGEMKEFCEANNIFSYAELLDYACINRNDWFRVLCDNGTYVMLQYLKSRSWTYERSSE